MKYTVLETPMGWMGVVASEAGVRRLTIPLPTPDEAMSDIQHDLGGAELDNDYFIELDEKLQRLFSGEDVPVEDADLDLPQAPEFTRAVWKATREIPHGETRSYGDLAAAVGRPRGARAVGQVMASNPVAVSDPVPSGNRQRPGIGWIRRPHRDEEAAPETGGGRRGTGALLSALHNS